jgi:hypothetical protein
MKDSIYKYAKNIQIVIDEMSGNKRYLNPINFNNAWVNLLNDRLFSRIMDEAMVELGHTSFARGEKQLKELVIKEISK